MNQRILDNMCSLCQAILFEDGEQGYTLHINEAKLLSEPAVDNYLAMLNFVQVLKPGGVVVVAIGQKIICPNCFRAGIDQILELINAA
jgi:hypothetical protein